MKSKLKSIILVMLVLAATSVLTAEIKSHFNKKKNNDTSTETRKETDMSLYYSYADIKDDVAYLANDKEDEEILSRLIDALSQSQPVNAAYIKSVCRTINADPEVYENELSGLKDDDYITKEQFDSIYDNIQKSGIVKNLERYDVFILAVEEKVDDEGRAFNSVYDGYKDYRFIVDVPDEYKDRLVNVYASNGKVFKINGYSENNYLLKNVWINSVENGVCSFLYNGVEKDYGISSDLDVEKDCVYDLIINNTGIVSVDKPSDIYSVKVDKVSDEYLYVEDGKKRIKISDDFVIYNASDDIICEKNKEILRGYKNIELIKNGDIAVAAVIREELINDEIRVILSNDSFDSYDMEYVEFTGDGSFTVKYPDGVETTYESGSEVKINYFDYEEGSEITVLPLDKSGIKILSINRTCGNPVYFGSLEIDIHNESLNVINVVPLETYLYGVVSSEMPSGGYPEALKAIAVCCRAYAYTKLNDGSFADYNAHLDDSSLCRLYNDYELRDDCIQAVKDTYGLVPSYKNVVIAPFTYSTCYGVTSTNDEVWGGTAYEYFFSRVDNEERSVIDLSDEEDFKAFLTNSMNYETVDKDMPYYRWSIDYTREEMSDAIDSMLLKRASISSDNIKIVNEDGTYENCEIDSIGDVLNVTVDERTPSGVVSALVIEGSEASIRVTGSSNIRNLITPEKQQIVRQDKSVITGWTSLPSPYYYIEKTDEGFTVHGGGFGYGVGLSTNGAANLADEGYNFKYIIHHYYAYVKFVSIYDNHDEEEIIEEETVED